MAGEYQDIDSLFMLRSVRSSGTGFPESSSRASPFLRLLRVRIPRYLQPQGVINMLEIGIKPNNVVINQLFGGYTGLSLIPITFDWT